MTTSAHPRPIDYWRFAGPISPTRYPDLHIQGRGDHYRILATDECGDTDTTGPQYATKIEALSDLDRQYECFTGSL